jgi:protein-L-isoaspartate O-methyltransferase
LFIPVGEHIQQILQVKKDADGKVTQTDLMGVRVSSSQNFRAGKRVDVFHL